MPRERYQDPTIRQNKNGSFYIKVWLDVRTNKGLARKQRRIVLGPLSIGKREAERLKRIAMEKINRASYVIQSQVPFSQLLDEYGRRHVRKLASSTQDKYASHLKNHIRPEFGELQLHEITCARVDDWIASKEKDGLSWNTRTDIRNIMSGIFTCAKKWGMYDDANPIEGVYVGRKRAVREKRKLTDDQTRMLLASLPEDVRLMCCVSLFCTLRISEVLGLQEKHIDFENGLIHVRQRFYRGDIDVVKGQKSERSVPMGLLAEPIRAVCIGDPDWFVFAVATSRGLSRDDRDIHQHFLRPAAKRLGIYWQGFGWHSLRREAVTSLSAELGIGQAMALAGHSSADMSLAYTLPDRERQEKAIRARQERLMLGKPESGLQ